MAKEKILIIEDEQYLADLYKLKFDSEGYNVSVAYDGKAGIEEAKKFKPDIILLDIVMPVMDGYETLVELKKSEETKDITVYILSNLGQADEIKRGLSEGADNYLIKANMTPNQLVNRVRKALDKKK